MLELEVNLGGFHARIHFLFWKGLGCKEWKKLEKDSEPGNREGWNKREVIYGERSPHIHSYAQCFGKTLMCAVVEES